VAAGARAELAREELCLSGSPEAAEQLVIIPLYFP